MPIVSSIYRVLYDNANLQVEVSNLINLQVKSEF